MFRGFVKAIIEQKRQKCQKCSMNEAIGGLNEGADLLIY